MMSIAAATLATRTYGNGGGCDKANLCLHGSGQHERDCRIGTEDDWVVR